MTETATTEAPAPAAPDQFVTVVTGTLASVVNEANELATKYAANSKDSNSLVHEIREDNETEDKTITAFRAWKEQALAAVLKKETEVDEYIKANLMPKGDEAFDADKAKVSHGELKSRYNATIKMLKTLPGYDDSWTKDVPEFKNLRGGTVSAGAGSGGRRPRLADIALSTDNGATYAEVSDTKTKDAKGNVLAEPVKVTNLTYLAKVMGDKDHASTKVSVQDLQAALFAEAKTEDLSTVPGKVFTFSFSPDEKHTYFVRVTTSDPDAA